jgi:hypothetical protein
MPVGRSEQNFNIYYKIFSARDYALLCNALCTYDWSSLYIETFVDAAVDRLNVAVTQATDFAVPSGQINKTNYVYRRYKTLKTGGFYDIFFLPVTRLSSH